MPHHVTPPASAFFATVAPYIVSQQAQQGADLSHLTCFVPTTRCQFALQTALAQAGLAAGFKALAMPTILVPSPKNLLLFAQAHGYEAPQTPHITSSARLSLMATLVGAYTAQNPPEKPLSQQLAMAENLLSVHDGLTVRGLGLAELSALIPGHLAQHWQHNTAFLQLAFGAYRNHLAENNLTDAALAHAHVLAFLEGLSLASPAYVLGFNSAFDGWETVMATWAKQPLCTFITHGHGTTYAHETLGLEALTPLPTPLSTHQATAEEAAQFVLPANPAASPLPAAAATALPLASLTPCPSPTTEADAVVALAKQALLSGTPCTLISPDMAFLRQVQHRLNQHGVAPYQSFNVPLFANTGVQKALAWLRVLASNFSPEALFAFLPHWESISADTKRAFDAHLLRGMHLESGLAYWQARAAKAPQHVQQALGALADFSKAFPRFDAPLATWQQALMGWCAAETAANPPHATANAAPLAPKPESTDARAEEAHAQLNHLLAHLEGLALGDINAQTLLTWLEHFAKNAQTVRPTVTHDKLQLWDPLEARLLPLKGVVICCSLTAEKWPALPPADMWLNRSLKQALGLPLPETIVQTAQADFAQLMAECAASGAAVHLTHATQTATGEATPSAVLTGIPSRENTAVLEALAEEDAQATAATAVTFTQTALENVASLPHTTAAPLPQEMTEGPNARAAQPVPTTGPQFPSTWYAKTLEQLMNCPYQTYAEKVLHLKAWDRVNEPSDAAFLGNLAHTLLESLHQPTEAHGVTLQPFAGEWAWEKEAEIQKHYAENVATLLAPLPAAQKAAWQSRLQNVLRAAVAETLHNRHHGWQQTAAEATWSHTLETTYGPLTLKAKLDRVESRTAENGTTEHRAIDYKTGEPPSGKALELGEKPQLPLAAFLGQCNGKKMAGIQFWKTNMGKGAALRVAPRALSVEQHAEIAQGITHIAAHYTAPEAPLPAVPGAACTHCTFAPLCRKKEWAVG